MQEFNFFNPKILLKLTNTCENGDKLFLKGLGWHCQRRDYCKENCIRVNNGLYGLR